MKALTPSRIQAQAHSTSYLTRASLFSLVLPLSLALSLLNGCSSSEDTTTVEKAAVVKLSAVQTPPNQDSFSFPAVVSAVKTIDVSFEVAGRLIQLDMTTGKDVEKGHILATIDPKPFERRLQEAEARFKQAQRELSRVESLSSKGLVAQNTLDNAKTEYELAEINLNQAQQDLGYTQLTAPFDAKVSQRLVENNSFVKAGSPIARLQDVSRLYFNVNVPERLLTANQGRTIKQATATIIGANLEPLSVTYVEHSTQPDPISQTYQAVFATAANEDQKTYPGARAVVTITLNGYNAPLGVVVPFTALVGNTDKGFHVWRYSADKKQVTKVPVNVIQLQETIALVSGDLSLADQVVSAGASKMREGLSVKPYQAE